MIGLAVAVQVQRDRMELTEAEGRTASVETHGHEAARVAPFGCLVLDPGRFNRSVGPQHHDHLGILERAIDLGCEARATLNVAVPPDVVAGIAYRLRQPLGGIHVFACIAQKDFGHRASPPATCAPNRQTLQGPELIALIADHAALFQQRDFIRSNSETGQHLSRMLAERRRRQVRIRASAVEAHR